MVPPGADETEEEVRPERGPSRPGCAYLFRVLEWETPQAVAVRFRLQGLPEVELGRGERRIELLQRPAGNCLRLQLPDRWTSTVHARMLSSKGWRIEDVDSKNGTWANGEAIEKRELADGDVIEVGHALYLFRAELPWTPEAVVEALPPRLPGLGTLNPGLAAQLERVPAIAASKVPVILHGETGTGKEVMARALHQLSGRSGAFTAVNCAALPRTLVESELFGYRKGAFSGAADDRPGLVRSADGGTLLLDEIGDLTPEAQGALLRVLQEGEVLPVGATKPIKVDVRVLAATHRDLQKLVTKNQFRADLLARLSGFTLRLPPLRERREDLSSLVQSLLARLAPGRPLRLEADAARALLRHRWPLNVRELEKALSSAVALTSGDEIALASLPEDVQKALGPEPLPEVDGDERKARLLALLQTHKGNVSAVAQALDLSRMQVHRWIRRYAIDVSVYRGRG